MGYWIGIDLGGSSIKAVTVGVEGEVFSKERVPFDLGEKMEWAEKIRELIDVTFKQRGGMADRIGICAPGLASKDELAIAHMPGRLQGLEGLNWQQYLGFPSRIPVMNDAHSALLGEAWLGAARGFENVIMLTLGTGVGGAAIVDGRLLRGEIARAGHLGHSSLDPSGPADITGTPGSLEVAIGNCTIQDRSGGKFHDTADLVEAYRHGDSHAQEIWLKSVHDLACAVCSFINILDPEAVIIGGGIAQAGDALMVPLEQYLAPIEWRPGGHCARLIPAELGGFAGAIGAAYNAGFQKD